MRITTQGVERMKAETTFMSKFKWDMGDTHAVPFPKIMLDPTKVNKFGEMQPIAGLASVAAREILYKRDITKELSETLEGAELDEAVNEAIKGVSDEELFVRYNKFTDLALSAKFCRKISIETPEALKRKAEGKGNGKYERAIASKGYKDNEGKYHKDALDELAGIIGSIIKAKKDYTKNKYADNPDLDENQIQALVDQVGKSKPIKGVSTKIATEIIATKCETNKVPKLASTMFSTPAIYVMSPDHLDKISTHLHTDADINLDYLELNIIHKVYREQTDNLSKAKSGLNVSIVPVEEGNRLAKHLDNFDGLYRAYRKTSPMTTANIDDKVPEFRTLADEELYSMFKGWISDNRSFLSENDQKKYSDVLEKVNSVMDEKDINEVIKGGTELPNTIQGNINGISESAVEDTTLSSQDTGDSNGLNAQTPSVLGGILD